MPRTKKEEDKLKELGTRLKEIREEKGMSLRDLAYELGKDAQSIHRVEKGSTNPSVLYLSKICSALDITVAELLDGIA